LQEAAQVDVPRDKMVGPYQTCPEQSIVPAGEAAISIICATWHGTGSHFSLMQEVLLYAYARDKGSGPAEDVGT
jgi:hypothetical protein